MVCTLQAFDHYAENSEGPYFWPFEIPVSGKQPKKRETLTDAVMRETLEEAALAFVPEALLGVYMTHIDRPNGGAATFLRFTFCGRHAPPDAPRALDTGIVRTLWLTPDELRACRARHRTPLVMRSIEDYLAGRRFPLDFVHTHSVGPPNGS